MEKAAQGHAHAAAGARVQGLIRLITRRLVLCILLCAPAAVLAQKPASPVGFRGVYARIDMRSTEQMVARLGVAYGTDKREAMREVQRSASSYNPLVLYALANALIEDYSERAIFWYHVGRLRAVYDALRCRDKTAQNGLIELRKRLSPQLASNQFYRRDRLVAIAQKAIDWDAANPRDYDQRWITLYGEAARETDGEDAGDLFVPESEWPEILKRVHETHLKSVQDFAAPRAPTQ